MQQVKIYNLKNKIMTLIENNTINTYIQQQETEKQQKQYLKEVADQARPANSGSTDKKNRGEKDKKLYINNF